MVAALALVQRVEEAIKERLGEKECISEFGEAIYPFLASCGIDAKSIKEVIDLFTHVIEMRNEFFPNATFCATETLERLLRNELLPQDQEESSKQKFPILNLLRVKRNGGADDEK